MISLRRRLFFSTCKSLVMICLVVSTGFLMFGVRTARALDPNGIVTYQGRILDGNGVPVASASVNMVFKLVSDSVGTSCYWSDSSATCASATAMAVTLTDGLFSVNLGDTSAGFAAAIPNSVFGDDASVYLEVIIEGETLLPRKLITAAPYALNSQTLDGVDSTGFLSATGDTATGIYDFTGSVFSGLNALVFEGATANDFESIFQFTDPTVSDKTITFKDETGTVAYLSDVTAASSKWTDGGTTTYLTSLTDDLAVGGTAPASASFGVDESANSIYVGEGATTDGNIIFKASNAAIGTLTYTTADTFAFTGGEATFSNSVTANDYACTTGDCIDFTELEDTLDLDAALILNQGTNTWTQNFTGTTTDGYNYVANDLTTGNGILITVDSSLDTVLGVTGNAFKIDYEDAAPTNDRLFTIESDCIGDVTCSGVSDNNSVFRIMASGEAFSDVGFTAGGASTKYYDASITSSSAFTYISPTSFTWQNELLSPLATLTSIAGVGGNLSVTNDVTVTNDLMVGGVTPSTSPFGVNEGTDSVYIGEGSVANGNIIFKASDADTGTLTYTTDDTFAFTGGATSFDSLVTASDYACSTGDCIDFTELEDTLDLDASLILNQGTNTWTQNFTGTATTGTSFVADSLTTGTAVQITSTSLTDGTLFSVSSSSVGAGTGSLMWVDHSATYTAPGTINQSPINFSRSITANGAAAVVAMTEPVVTISNTGSAVAGGTLSDSTYLLKLAQNYGGAGGALYVADSGTGVSLSLNKTTDSTTMDINSVASTASIVDLDATAITTGNGLLITADSSLSTGSPFKIDYEDAAPTNDRLFTIESDCLGDVTCSGLSDNNLVFRIMASGEAFSDVGFTAGSASTNYYDASITSSSAFIYSSPTSFTWKDDAANTLAVITDVGTTGTLIVSNNITTAGDLAVNGGDITSTATTWNLDVGDTGTVNFRDGANVLMAIKDQGTTGNIEITGDLFVDGDNIDSAGAPLVLNADAADEVRVGTGTPGVATGTGDLYTTGGIEADGELTVGSHAAIGSGATVVPEIVLAVGESFATGAGFASDLGFQSKVYTTGTGAGTAFIGGDFSAENQTTASTIGAVKGVAVTAVENGIGSTVTSLIGIDASAVKTAGTATKAYGIRSTATGGASNYSGYFYGAAVSIDSTVTPTVPDNAIGAGDLYVNNQFEIDGAGLTSETVMSLKPDSLDTGLGAGFGFTGLTTGIGLSVARPTSATDFSNVTSGLVDFSITDAGSSGDLLNLNNAGTGKGLKLMTANTSGFMATFIADGGADTNDGISIQGCLDLNPTTGCDLLKFYDGNGDIIGAIEGNGAGGVQLTSGGGADFAELFPGHFASFTEGDLIGITPTGEAIVANDPAKVIGVLSVARLVLGNAADENWEANGTYVPVAMLGQVPVKVNSLGGSIAVGDYITLSSVPGVGMKSTGVGYVIGRALEDAVGNDTISVFIQPSWQAQGVLLADGRATDVLTDLEISGNVTIKNELDETTAQITDSGDIAISGNIYPSDRGMLQTDKYIYYDGSAGAGGDFMRTNASGWATGSYDFAEMFPASESLSPGEVVIFSSNNETVSRSSGLPYDDHIAGIISTRPGFLAGDNRDGDVPVALAGRVPTYVSAENGNIAVGDPLTTSTRAGYAMKATEAGPIVGYAMEPFSGSTGVIVAVVRPSYYDGGPVAAVPEVNTSASGIMTVAGLDVSGALNMNAGSINNVGSLSGIGGTWRLEENGDFVTDGRLISVVNSYQNEDVETYAVTSRETTIQLSGTATLQAGSARVNFEEIDPGFNDVIADSVQYRVFLTPSAPTGQLFAMNRTLLGFDINDMAGSNGVTVDWMAVAYHKDFAPTSAPIVPASDVSAPEVMAPVATDTSTSEIISSDEPVIVPVEEVIESTPVIDPIIFEEPVSNVTVVPEPDIVLVPTPEVVVDPIPEPTPEPPAVTEVPTVTDSTTTP